MGDHKSINDAAKRIASVRKTATKVGANKIPSPPGVGVLGRIISAAKKVNLIRATMKKIQGTPAKGVSGTVKKELRRSPGKTAKLMKLAIQQRKALDSVDTINSREVLKMADKLRRLTEKNRK